MPAAEPSLLVAPLSEEGISVSIRENARTRNIAEYIEDHRELLNFSFTQELLCSLDVAIYTLFLLSKLPGT